MADTITRASNAHLVSTIKPKIDTVRAKTDNLPNNTSTYLAYNIGLQKLEGTTSYPNVITEETVFELTPTQILNLKNPRICLVNATKTGTLRVYEKLNGVYRLLDSETTVAGATYTFLLDMVTDNDFKVTYQGDVLEGGAIDLYYFAGWVGGA